MTVDQIHLVRKTFQRVEEMGHVAALVFYRRLFEKAPELRPMFRNDIEVQAKKLTDMLAAAVSLLTRPGEFESTLEALGARHVGYGVKTEHYEVVGAALLDMLVSVLGTDFVPEVRLAWTALLSEISNSMLAGAAKVESPITLSPAGVSA